MFSIGAQAGGIWSSNMSQEKITWYNEPMVAEVGGMTLLTKKKRASSGLRLILFLITSIESCLYVISKIKSYDSFQRNLSNLMRK